MRAEKELEKSRDRHNRGPGYRKFNWERAKQAKTYMEAKESNGTETFRRPAHLPRLPAHRERERERLRRRDEARIATNEALPAIVEKLPRDKYGRLLHDVSDTGKIIKNPHRKFRHPFHESDPVLEEMRNDGLVVHVAHQSSDPRQGNFLYETPPERAPPKVYHPRHVVRSRQSSANYQQSLAEFDPFYQTGTGSRPDRSVQSNPANVLRVSSSDHQPANSNCASLKAPSYANPTPSRRFQRKLDPKPRFNNPTKRTSQPGPGNPSATKSRPVQLAAPTSNQALTRTETSVTSTQDSDRLKVRYLMPSRAAAKIRRIFWAKNGEVFRVFNARVCVLSRSGQNSTMTISGDSPIDVSNASKHILNRTYKNSWIDDRHHGRPETLDLRFLLDHSAIEELIGPWGNRVNRLRYDHPKTDIRVFSQPTPMDKDEPSNERVVKFVGPNEDVLSLLEDVIKAIRASPGRCPRA